MTFATEICAKNRRDSRINPYSQASRLLAALGVSSNIVHAITSDMNIINMSESDVAMIHSFNISMLSSMSDKYISFPEIGFGFNEKNMYPISFRNYGVVDYLSIIAFNKNEFGTYREDMNKHFIISQAKSIINYGSVFPMNIDEFMDWIFGEQAFVSELYYNSHDVVKLRLYFPKLMDKVRSNDKSIMASSMSSAEKNIHMRLGRKSKYVTGHIVTSEYSVGYFSDNPFFTYMENRVARMKKPSLSVVGG